MLSGQKVISLPAESKAIGPDAELAARIKGEERRKEKNQGGEGEKRGKISYIFFVILCLFLFPIADSAENAKNTYGLVYKLAHPQPHKPLAYRFEAAPFPDARFALYFCFVFYLLAVSYFLTLF